MALYLPMLAFALVKESEGLRLEAYLCPAGKWTIGYGHTGPEVTKGLKWTQAQAEAALIADMLAAAQAVDRLCTVPINLNQRGALASFVFNLGAGRLKASTLLRKLNAGDTAGAAEQFLVWDKATVNCELKQLPGLTKRRRAERELFLTP